MSSQSSDRIDAAPFDVEGDGHQGLANLACYGCKRRKVRCDRQLPVCALCRRFATTCQYPEHSEKPGPKIGSKHKNRRTQKRDFGLHRPPGQPRACEAQPTSTPNVTSSFSTTGSDGAAIIDDATSTSRSDEQTSQPYPTSAGVTSFSSPHHSRSVENRQQSSDGPTFSQIMYPLHEARTRPQSPIPAQEASLSQATEASIMNVCKGLEISRQLFDYLIESYFANMTSFTLFKPNALGDKLQRISSSREAEAFVAAMFSFSARFHPSYRADDRPNSCPSASHFAKLASNRIQDALEERGDETPPLSLLQSCILVTFYQLTQSVRSKSWRALGNCVRIAYDMNLHLIDASRERHLNPQPFGRVGNDLEQWSILEERRRAWWAIWEMDVFASTIRCSPMAIDWTQNLTLLPISDTSWLNNDEQNSCFLVQDPCRRWKELAKSGNKSAKAWFIVINSLMRNVQLIVYNRGEYPANDVNSRSQETADELGAIGNCLFCTISSLPPDLVYRGESLDFDTMASADDLSCHQAHADMYAIHIMTQLVRFMIHHHRICAQAPWQNPSSLAGPRRDNIANNARGSVGGTMDQDRFSSSWSNYMNAAKEIVTIVRTSDREHHKYVNPFLVNTVWFAAAAQIACRVFRPPSFDLQLVDTNYDVLALVIDRFITFWNILDRLKSRLTRIEAGLRAMMNAGTRSAERADAGAELRESTAIGSGGDGDGTSNDATSAMNNDLAAAAGLYQGLHASSNYVAEAPGTISQALDPQAIGAFDPLLYDGDGMIISGGHPLLTDALGQISPYGADEWWLTGVLS